MLDWIIEILVLGFAAWVIWSIFRPRYHFEISVADGRPSLRKGKLTRAVLERVAEVCRESGVDQGWIGGILHGRRITLRFSHHFPTGSRQRLRNQWQTIT